MSTNTPEQPQEQQLETILGIRRSDWPEEFAALDRLIAINRLEARIDELMKVNFTYRHDRDMAFIASNLKKLTKIDKDLDFLRVRVADLQKQLDTLKGVV